MCTERAVTQRQKQKAMHLLVPCRTSTLPEGSGKTPEKATVSPCSHPQWVATGNDAVAAMWRKKLWSFIKLIKKQQFLHLSKLKLKQPWTAERVKKNFNTTPRCFFVIQRMVVWLRALMQSDCLYSSLFFEHYNRILLCEWVIELCSVLLIDGMTSHNAFAFYLD